MPGSTQFTLDLTSYTETTRRELYDAVVRQHFSPIPLAAPDDYPGPSFTPDAAELAVFCAFGRWFAAWRVLDEPQLPEDRRIELVRIQADPSSPSGLLFAEV